MPASDPLLDACRAAATALLAEHPGAEPRAAEAERAFEQLVHHLGRVVGEAAIRTLFRRAVLVATTRHAWLAPALTDDPPLGALGVALHAVLAERAPAESLDAFGDMLAAFANLLRRLIGEPLVRRLFGEVWPAAFRSEKESS